MCFLFLAYYCRNSFPDNKPRPPRTAGTTVSLPSTTKVVGNTFSLIITRSCIIVLGGRSLLGYLGQHGVPCNMQQPSKMEANFAILLHSITKIEVGYVGQLLQYFGKSSLWRHTSSKKLRKIDTVFHFISFICSLL